MDRATVLVVQANDVKVESTRRALEDASFTVTTADNGKEAIESICALPPLCVVIQENLTDSLNGSILAELKSDNVYGHLPVIAVVTEEDLHRGLDWEQLPADDYVVEPYSEEELVSRIKLALARARRDLHANPLTGLPGNPTIMMEAERRLAAGVHFAVAHADLDHFKAFNDRYGFARGDEVLRMSARVIANTVRGLNAIDTYVGHIGGDDFVFIVPSELAVEACERILRDFDQIVPNFYDDEDRVRGSIHSTDRKGLPQVFPLMTCSIAVVDTSTSPMQHIGDLCTRVAEVKSFAKKVPGSNFLVDRRKR